ncbi:efflux RND transporter periplasmic adaptor subunit [Aliikangiella sp. IMCC44359]|uniref:efflux RND transporter periplasmic adaptor subunit n=1 Tax=Aliikangiella sp. IMCC44359 TaxID=3459125 RepID=UPI00403AAFA5
MIQDTSSQDVILKKNKASSYWLKIILILAGLIILMIYSIPTLSNWSSADISIDRNRIRTAEVTNGDFIRDIALQGNIVAANSPKLYAPAMGTITLHINPGEKVEKGDLVATINSPELTNRLQQEQSKLKSLEIELQRKKIQAKQNRIKKHQQIQLEKVVLDAAKREKKRAEQSIKIQAISQLDYEKSIDDLRRSQLKYNFAQEQFELEKENLLFEIKTAEFEYNQYHLMVENTQRLVKELKIIAPVSGIVGSWSVEQKSAVALNQALLTIVDLSAFQVEIEIPENYADELGIGMLAQVTYNGHQYDATVATISPEVTDNIVKGRIAFTTKPPPGIKQNQRVSSKVILEQKSNILYLPRGSFIQHYGGRKVFVINDNIATLKNINLGSYSIDKVEVISGLKPGEKVIISNTDFVNKAETLILN